MIKNALLLFGICAAIFIVFLPSYLQMQDLSEKHGSYERQIKELTQENEALLEERRRLEEDPAYFERFAREKFGIIKDGETIYKFLPAGTAGTAGTAGMTGTANTTVVSGSTASRSRPKAVKKSSVQAMKRLKKKKKAGSKAVKKPATGSAVKSAVSSSTKAQ